MCCNYFIRQGHVILREPIGLVVLKTCLRIRDEPTDIEKLRVRGGMGIGSDHVREWKGQA